MDGIAVRPPQSPWRTIGTGHRRCQLGDGPGQEAPFEFVRSPERIRSMNTLEPLVLCHFRPDQHAHCAYEALSVTGNALTAAPDGCGESAAPGAGSTGSVF